MRHLQVIMSMTIFSLPSFVADADKSEGGVNNTGVCYIVLAGKGTNNNKKSHW